MRTVRVKKYIGLGILLLMTGGSVGLSKEPPARAQEKWLWNGNFRAEESVRTEAETQSGQKRKQKGKKTGQFMKKGTISAAGYSEDSKLYAQCLQNLNQGNSITYADGYYYFRSQTENYSLCRMKEDGTSAEVIADQIPGSIYVKENQVYFTNVSDNRTLYRVGTDGSGLKKLSDFPMQELVVWNGKIYFRLVYGREYDSLSPQTERAEEKDWYLYSMNLDGSGCQLLIPKLCMEFMMDERWLYYLTFGEGKNYVLHKTSLDGKEDEIILKKEHPIENMLLYRGNLYWIDAEQRLVRLKAQGEEEILASDVQYFTIAHGLAYAINNENIRRIALTTGEGSLLTEKEKSFRYGGRNRQDIYPWYNGYHNRGIFLVNGKVFAKYYESNKKGVLWHVLNGNTFVVFEDMVARAAEDLVLDTSLLYEAKYYYPGRLDNNAEQYLDTEGELHYEETFGTTADGYPYGSFSISLPRFNSELASHKQLNRQMEKLLGIALEEKASFFQEISKRYDEEWTSWGREYGYSNIFIGETYISMNYYSSGHGRLMRDWVNPMPLIFDRDTGRMLHTDNLFAVEESIYMKRLTGAIYKYCEMTGKEWWNDIFDNNVLAKNRGKQRCYLTPDGIVLCYDRYEVMPGSCGNPAFEIPYEWFADIFKR